jgi:hypothetical protein
MPMGVEALRGIAGGNREAFGANDATMLGLGRHNWTQNTARMTACAKPSVRSARPSK